jgi:pilus assembly protein FimV
MARKFAAVVFSLGCLHASSVMALGLGELTLDSFLNEPLKARVDLLNTGGLHQDEIRIRLATREDFEKMGLDRAYFLTNIKFEVKLDDQGRAQVVMSSDDPVLEPYLDFIVEARWPSGRLLREYTVLVDPPVFDKTSPVISASQRVAEVEGEPAPVKKTQGKAATEKTGTHVDVKKSELSPGAMPERDYNAAASDAPIAGSRYMIHRNDTLWEVAAAAKPAGASVHQTMLDIQRLNPNAFIDGNINRVKAGYIVYLPSADDISSADLESALAEVRQQNDDWRAGKASQPSSTSGPSLRISAEPEESADSSGDAVSDQRQVGATAGTAAMEDMDKAGLENAETAQRLQAMEQQVETLQRIVSLKDDQIAALQGALAESGGEADISAAPGIEDDLEQEGVDAAGVLEEAQSVEEDIMASGEEASAEVVAEPVVDVEVAPEQAVTPPPAAQAPVAPAAVKQPAEQGGGFMSYILYILGAAVVAILGFVLMRRRGESTQEAPVLSPAAPAPKEDVFADVQLKDQELEVPAPEEVALETPVAPGVEEDEEVLPEVTRDNRGYGERKHDEYASDADTGDALAEADIYIAYGRYPQAIDLLNNAVATEPNNPAYRLKLLEMHAEMGDRDAAMQQFAELQAINDADSLTRAQVVLDSLTATPTGSVTAAPEAEPILDEAPPLDVDLDFGGLEIESSTEESEIADDLDLSADFGDSDLAEGGDDEDLVIAAETNGLSTKLDLARAYLDMGDDDGARQILEEVAAEGSDELQAEARALLDRIG